MACPFCATKNSSGCFPRTLDNFLVATMTELIEKSVEGSLISSKSEKDIDADQESLTTMGSEMSPDQKLSLRRTTEQLREFRST